MLSFPLIEDSTIKTACINGIEIRYNQAYIDGLSIDEIKGLLCHEILHIANLHHTRREGRDIKQWNMAADFAINPLILESGLKLPEGALIDRSFKDLSAEQIFKLLPTPEPEDQPGNSPQEDPEGNQQGQGKQPTPDPGGCGAVEDSPAKTEGEKQEQEAKIKQKVAQAAAIGKKAGKLPAYLQRMIDEILEPKINWKEVLARFLYDTARNDYSFKKPNARFIQSGFYLPSLYNEEPGKIIFLVDTSGSIDKELFNQFSGELQDVCSEMKNPLTVIYIDTEVQDVQEIEPDETIKPPQAGGGTDFAPGFEHIEQNDLCPKAAIYLTDGHCGSYPEQTPDYPVLWVVYNNKNFNPKFGEVIEVNQ
jgi:predicted metal-dependent peptidase